MKLVINSNAQVNPNFLDKKVDVTLLFRGLTSSKVSKLELNVLDSPAAQLVRKDGQDTVTLPFELTAGVSLLLIGVLSFYRHVL